jgi:chemotaxis protein methyltransferase CheR
MMLNYSETLGLPDNAFIILRNLIHERLGLDYAQDKRDLLADKLSPLVIEKGFDSFVDYYYLLKYDPGAEAEWQRVMDVLSVPETYFWREIQQIEAFVNLIVPQLYQANPEQPLRIWSAACASGEEPLTIAMVLNEAGWFERMPIEIKATDMSLEALKRAQAGLYRERSFRSLPPALRERYFQREDDQVSRVTAQLHQRVSWAQANMINEADLAQWASAPAIFCRNVFIYFSPAVITQTAVHFYHYMPNPGYLFLGAAESLLRLNVQFKLKEIGGAFVYVKEEK